MTTTMMKNGGKDMGDDANDDNDDYNGGGNDDDNDDNNWKQTVKLSLLQFHRLFLFVISSHNEKSQIFAAGHANTLDIRCVISVVSSAVKMWV